MGLFEEFVRRKEQGHVPGDDGHDRRDLASDPVVHRRAPLGVERRQLGLDQEESIRFRERGAVRSDQPAAEIDPEQVGVHLGGKQRAGHQDARVDLVEHALAEDARVHQPERELPLVAGDDEAQDPDVLVSPSGQELGHRGQRRRHAAPDRVLAGEGDHLDEVRVAQGPAAALREAHVDQVEELLLAGDALGADVEQEMLHRLRDADEPMGHLPVDRPGLFRGLQEIGDREVAAQVGPDAVREVVGLVDDHDEFVQGPPEPREEPLEDLAEKIIVVAHDQVRPRGGVHRDLVRAHAARPARPDELLHVERALEDRGDDRRVVPREEGARPRLDLVIAELVERAAVGRGALLEAHRLLRDQVDRRDPRPPRLDPTDRLDRDAMLALPRRQEEDELVRAEGELERRDEGHGGLADPGRGVGEQVSTVLDRAAGIGEEVRLTLANPIERPGDPDGARAHGGGRHERFQLRPP